MSELSDIQSRVSFARTSKLNIAQLLAQMLLVLPGRLSRRRLSLVLACEHACDMLYMGRLALAITITPH